MAAMELLHLPSEALHYAAEQPYWVLLCIFVVYCATDALGTWRVVRKQADHTLVGSPISFSPAFLLNVLFATSAAKLLQRGYDKFKKSTFQLIRNDGPIVMLPQHLLEELSTLPATVASPHGALEHDLLGHFTGLNLILENRLHHQIVQRRLTPRLSLLVPRLQDAAKIAFADQFPGSCDEWTEFMPYQVLGRVSARIAAEAVVGPAFRDNETWLEISFEYTESLFRTVVVLRTLPDWLKPIVAPMLPSYWAGKKYIREAHKLLAPKIQELMDKVDEGSWRPEDESADDLNIMSWLSAMAKGRDRDAKSIAHVQVLIALASVHTTLLRMVNVLYDITAAGDGLRDELLKEISEVAARNGGLGWESDATNANELPYDSLDKLDSVMTESQRLSPPTTLGLKRIFKAPHTFKDGTYVAAGTYACMPITAIENDAQNTANPEEYDGLRSFRALEEARKTGDRQEIKQHLFTTPTPTVLNFGYGKTACPGRFFAGVVIKMVVVKMLTEYEFDFLPGTERPGNLMAHEFLFTWPWQKMLIRRRKTPSCPY